MKVSVKVGDEWLQVPCSDGKQCIRWLGDEATRRYYRTFSPLLPANQELPKVTEVRRQSGNALLDFGDNICDVLDDNDFVVVLHEEIALAPTAVNGHKDNDPELHLDGERLSIAELYALSTGDYKIKLKKIAEERVLAAREIVETILAENRVVYGITTGFGKFARTVIPKDKLLELQENLIRSHAAGVGDPLTPQRTRMLLALRINVLAKGHSGISLATLRQLVDAFNASCLPFVPEQGTVGASGDLAPLSHLALGMMGEGKMWSPSTGWSTAKEVLFKHGLSPIKPQAKEGLALINGTQLITALGAEAVERSRRIARQADVVAAMTLEVLKGTSRAFDSDVHLLRPHPGQNMVAKRLRSLLHSEAYPSEIAESHRFCDRVQDAYTLRCTPQVHGISHDTIKFVAEIITTEMNSATDNPNDFQNICGCPHSANLYYDAEKLNLNTYVACQWPVISLRKIVLPSRGEIISAGHFHGEYPAKACDYLAIGVHELAAMSERRVERLVNPALSELPAFLVKEGGLNSGFMLAHCTAASLVSENKVLCHPSSVDSLSTSAGTEDHVSMGGFSARKVLKILDNVERVIAIELLAACQAMEFLRPLKTTQPLEAVYNLVRDIVPAWDRDRYMSPDIEATTLLLKENKIWNAVKSFVHVLNKLPTHESRVASPTATALHDPMSTEMMVENTILFSRHDSESDDLDGPPTRKRVCTGHEHDEGNDSD